MYDDTIHLPRLGLLRLKERGYLPMNAKVGSATISEHAGKWYVSVCFHREHEETTPATGEPIGVDLGIKTLAVLSDGRTFENPKALRKNINALKRASRAHSRKTKGSKNRKKAKSRLARRHARIATIRQDALHKATSAIIARTKPDDERPATVVLEDLNIQGMLKNRKLSRAIAMWACTSFVDKSSIRHAMQVYRSSLLPSGNHPQRRVTPVGGKTSS